jgi:hypothetical protein
MFSARKSKEGKTFFTLALLFSGVIAGLFPVIFTIYFVVGRMLFCGNYWFSEEGALFAVQRDNPKYTEVVYIQRNPFAYGEIEVKNEKGEKKTFYLDTDIFWNIDVLEENK